MIPKFYRKSLNNFTFLLLFSFIFTSGFSQEKSNKELKKELKEKQKLDKQKTTEDLVNSKSFIFIANRAVPNGKSSIDLSSRTNYLKIEPEMIDSDMPFFGRSFKPGYANTDNGIKFKEKPVKFDIKNEKNKYKVNIEVKDPKDFYKLFLTIQFDGSATLSVSCNNLSTISYYGGISGLKTN